MCHSVVLNIACHTPHSKKSSATTWFYQPVSHSAAHCKYRKYLSITSTGSGSGNTGSCRRSCRASWGSTRWWSSSCSWRPRARWRLGRSGSAAVWWCGRGNTAAPCPASATPATRSPLCTAWYKRTGSNLSFRCLISVPDVKNPGVSGLLE